MSGEVDHQGMCRREVDHTCLGSGYVHMSGVDIGFLVRGGLEGGDGEDSQIVNLNMPNLMGGSNGPVDQAVSC